MYFVQSFIRDKTFYINLTFGYISNTNNINLAIFYSLFFSVSSILCIPIFIKDYSIPFNNSYIAQ
jgi:hypothetical protein